MGLLEWIWNKLPDRCQNKQCMRHGVRGNENVVRVGDDQVRLCDDCSAHLHKGGAVFVRRYTR